MSTTNTERAPLVSEYHLNTPRKMNAQEIKDFFRKMQEVADKMGWSRVEITLDEQDVCFSWDEYWSYGGHERHTESIPIDWIELPVDEIVARHKQRTVDYERDVAERKERERIEKEQKDAEASEKRDLANYERLKAKYEKP